MKKVVYALGVVALCLTLLFRKIDMNGMALQKKI
jgi:hypothetical protein